MIYTYIQYSETSMKNILDLPQSIYWGFLPGLLTALGGAYKDTIFEPFEFMKFWRSPILTFIWYLIIDIFYPTQPVILKIGFASMMERLSVETYKAVFNHAPGKFLNCNCVDNKCILQKDRGWFWDRINGKSYNGKIEQTP